MMAGRRPSRSPLRIAAVVGAIWGLVGYALLWGYTPVVIHPTFVASLPGTVLLFPVRVVLWIIHGVERAAGGPFDFSENNWWIGLAAAAVGAVTVLVVVWAVARVRAARVSGGEGLAESGERV
jgi:hypothetical protein